MTDQSEATPQNLYQITSNVTDMNTVLIERAELRRLQAENAGVQALVAVHQRTLERCLDLKAECAELEAMLDAVGAGGVGQSIQPQVQPDTAAQPEVRIRTSVPDGWKLVPVEPTDDMFIEGMEADLSGRPCLDDDKHVRSIWSAMLSSAPDAPLPPAATDEPQLDGDAQLAHQQCRAVAHLARSVANAYDVRASMVANDAQLANLIGETSAAAMERLGDELNSMDSASETDDWLNPIFDAAQQRWPGNETDAPQHAAQQKPVAWIDVKPNPFDPSCRGAASVQDHTLPPGEHKLYAAPQPTENLNCKSTQKRLATLWGYKKASQPLTNDEIDVLWAKQQTKPFKTHGEDRMDFARAIEAAHGITGGQQ